MGRGTRRITGALGAVVLATATTLLAPGAPAGAAVTATSTGTAVTVTLTGDERAVLRCPAGGAFSVVTATSTVVATPSVACAALTAVTVNGDGGAQTVLATDLTSAGSPALTVVSANLGAGADAYVESPLPDQVNLGLGADQLLLEGTGAANGTLALGGQDGDRYYLSGTAGPDTITVTQSSSIAVVSVASSSGTRTHTVSGVGGASLRGGEGDDTIDATGVTAGATVAPLTMDLYGEGGDDTLRGGARPMVLWGGAGTNLLVGGPAADALVSVSRTDVLRGGGGADGLTDDGTGPIGGRTIDNPSGPADDWTARVTGGDVAVRTRPGATGTTNVTVSLRRGGRQVLDPSVGRITIEAHSSGEPRDRGVLDLQALADQGHLVFAAPGTVVDITVPSGTWTVVGDPLVQAEVTFSNPAFEPIALRGVAPGALLVRGPIAEPQRRFAHRVLRDLEMRIPTSGQVAALRDPLIAGTRTRAQIVATITAGSTYETVAVERAFIGILRRATDAAGLAYWAGRLDGGLTIRRLRANLYGSPEYFTRYGYGDPPSYVTSAYRDILQRTPAPSEVDYWVGVLSSGRPRGSVAERFLNTPEARAVIVRDQFRRFADREPTAAELATWSPQVASTTSDGELALVRSLAASNAYYALS